MHIALLMLLQYTLKGNGIIVGEASTTYWENNKR